MVSDGVEIGEGAEEVSEEGGVYGGHRLSAVRKPVSGFNDGGLGGGDIEVDEEKEGGEEKWKSSGFGRH